MMLDISNLMLMVSFACNFFLKSFAKWVKLDVKIIKAYVFIRLWSFGPKSANMEWWWVIISLKPLLSVIVHLAKHFILFIKFQVTCSLILVEANSKSVGYFWGAWGWSFWIFSSLVKRLGSSLSFAIMI